MYLMIIKSGKNIFFVALSLTKQARSPQFYEQADKRNDVGIKKNDLVKKKDWHSHKYVPES